MNSKNVLAMFFSTLFAAFISVAMFYLVSAILAEQYIAITGKLIHENTDTNRALLHLVSQGSVLGALGGSLYVMQVIAHYIAFGSCNIVQGQQISSYWLYGFIVPMKGLMAGIIGITIVGGIILMIGGIDLLSDSHLFVLGCACIAGYSEQFLQKVIDLTEKKLEALKNMNKS